MSEKNVPLSDALPLCSVCGKPRDPNKICSVACTESALYEGALTIEALKRSQRTGETFSAARAALKKQREA